MDVALTIAAANLDLDATVAVAEIVGGTPVARRVRSTVSWGALPVDYLQHHQPDTFGYPDIPLRAAAQRGGGRGTRFDAAGHGDEPTDHKSSARASSTLPARTRRPRWRRRWPARFLGGRILHGAIRQYRASQSDGHQQVAKGHPGGGGLDGRRRSSGVALAEGRAGLQGGASAEPGWIPRRQHHHRPRPGRSAFAGRAGPDEPSTA